MNQNTKAILIMLLVIFILIGGLIYISIPKDREEVYNVSLGINPVKGNPDAENVIIEFSDFQCPACKIAEPIIEEILLNNNVAFYYRNFPLPMHKNSFIAAEAAQCANEQGQFWEYHDILFENQERLEKENLKSYAKELGLNQEQFDSCFDSEKYKDEINLDTSDGKDLGIRGTPTFFVNGKIVFGADKEKIEEAMI